jgi:hypothetical protein
MRKLVPELAPKPTVVMTVIVAVVMIVIFAVIVVRLVSAGVWLFRTAHCARLSRRDRSGVA